MQKMPSLLPRSAANRLLFAVVDVGVLACGWWLIALSVATCVEMAGRKLFRFSLQGVDEVGGYTFAVVSVIGFSYALLTRGHTRVDFFVARFSDRTRAALNVAATVTLFAMAAFATYRGYRVLMETVSLKAAAPTPLATPLWIPQTAWIVAWSVFAAVAFIATLDVLRLAARRSWDELNRRHGPQTLEEEIESETDIELKTGGAR